MKKIIISLITITLGFTSLNVNAYTKYFESEEDLYKYKKSIVIDTKEGIAKTYFYGKIVWKFPISSGNSYNPTPHGRFKIVHKNPMMRSIGSGLLMPYRMEFYGSGKYGIHGFPLYGDGTAKYLNEEEAVKEKASGGCVRLKSEHIKKLYEWTDPLTTIIII